MIMQRTVLICFTTCFSLIADCVCLEYKKTGNCDLGNLLPEVLPRTTATRKKRVVYGEEHLKNSEYLSTKYFVWIGDGNECDVPLPGSLLSALGKDPGYEVHIPNLGFVCSPTSNHLKCTGSLLMPRVVQTACHCVVNYVYNVPGDGRAVKLNVNEDQWHVYPGQFRVDAMNNGVAAERYLHHPKCQVERTLILYDFALIVLDHTMDPYMFQTNFAPTYPLQHLANMWTELMSKGKVCMNIGYGGYQAKYGPKAQISSGILRHGWSRSMDYTSCFEKAFPAMKEKQKTTAALRRYQDKASWFCTNIMPGNRTATHGTGPGDSGGPVTCDNEYLGIVSHSLLLIDLVSSTAFTPLENSAIYRKNLVEYLKNTEDIMYTIRDPIGYKYFPTFEPVSKWKKASTANRPSTESAAFTFPAMLVCIKLLI